MWSVIGLVVGLSAGAVVGEESPRESEKPSSPLPARVSRALDQALDRARTERLEKAELREDHSTFETAWEVESPHFRVRTVHSRTLAAQVCSDLEDMFPVFQRVLGTDFEPAERFPIFILRTLPEYNQFGDDHGAEHSSFSSAFYAAGHPERPVAIMFHRDALYFRSTLTHSVAHQFIAAAFPGGRPAWIDEGIASYFALYWDYDRAVTTLEWMRTNDRVIPIQALLAPNMTDFSDRSADRFAELGLLFTWLMWRHGDTYSEEVDGQVQAGSFQRFVRAAIRGASVADQPFMQWVRDQGPSLGEDFATHDFSS